MASYSVYTDTALADTPAPTLSFKYDVRQSPTVLYNDIFGMVALRFDISMPIPEGLGDERIEWSMHHNGQQKQANVFNIPRWEQKVRGCFFSCNGFDETVPQETVELLGFDNVWKHLNSVHDEAPMHFSIWGGDQIYSDFIFADIPFLKRWLKFDWDLKWTHEFSEETSNYVAQYYFNTYHETWERKEVRTALQTIPALMVWGEWNSVFDPVLVAKSSLQTITTCLTALAVIRQNCTIRPSCSACSVALTRCAFSSRTIRTRPYGENMAISVYKHRI